jgi:hypothetical protein
MKKLIRLGDTGEDVKKIQTFLKITADGHFGPQTLRAVKTLQASYGLQPDGIVGPQTQNIMFANMDELDSELVELPYDTLLMNPDQWHSGPNQPEYLFYHHTAGWHNPYNVVKAWDSDSRGKIGTEWIIGGPSIRDGSKRFDGQVVKCMPDGAWAYHLGAVDRNMHINSIGIEVCNFGPLTPTGEGFKTYAGQWVDDSQIEDLGFTWRGYRYWHKYSDAQLESLYDLTHQIRDIYCIDINNGLKSWLNQQSDEDKQKAFDYVEDAKLGRIKGLLSHSNVRTDKLDMSPQKNLIQMINNL